MLRKLLEMGGSARPDQGREETKLRAAMMLSKVFLQHLGPLSSLPTFTALWLTILDLVGQFCATASTDILADALPESLKNMLLVMDTSGRNLFFTSSGQPTTLWGVTWGKIDTFLPGLREELFPGWEKRGEKKEVSEPETKQAIVEDEVKIDTTCVETVNANVVETATVETVEVLKSEEPAIVTPASVAMSSIPSVTATVISCTTPTPVLASLTTTAPPSSMLSNYFISSAPRERNPSLPDPGPLPSPIPVSPLDPPTMPFTAFSLPTSPSHAPSSLFSPITPAPPILTTPSAPVAVPRPLLPTIHPVQPASTAPRHNNPLLAQPGDTTAFTSPQQPPTAAQEPGQVDIV